jgi:hypothetical protein
MDNVQNCDSYIDIPSSQTYGSELRAINWTFEHYFRRKNKVELGVELTSSQRCQETLWTSVLTFKKLNSEPLALPTSPIT